MRYMNLRCDLKWSVAYKIWCCVETQKQLTETRLLNAGLPVNSVYFQMGR